MPAAGAGGTTPSNTAHYSRRGPIAVIMMDHPPVNALGRPLRGAIRSCLEMAQADPLARAVVLIGTEAAFSAGADLKEKNVDLARNRADAKIPDQLDKPIIAAIGGFALGGGLELALCCHYRIATAAARLGLSEVKLGRLPGTGGTQRLPRLLGVQAACEMLLGGEAVDARHALSIGLIDRIAQLPLLDAALAYAEELVAAGAPVRRIRDLQARLPDSTFLDRERERLNRTVPGYAAPLRLLECIEAAVHLPFDEAKAIEERHGDAARISLEARGLQQLFFAERAALLPDGLARDWACPPIRRLAVLGSNQATDAISALAAARNISVQHFPMPGVTAGADEPARDVADLVLLAGEGDMPASKGPLHALAPMPHAVVTAARPLARAADQATARTSDMPAIHLFPPTQAPRLAEIVAAVTRPPAHAAVLARLMKQLGLAAVITRPAGQPACQQLQAAASRVVQDFLADGLSQQACRASLRTWGFDPERLVPLLAGTAAADASNEASEAVRQRVLGRMLEALVAAGRSMLDTGQVARASDIDVICIVALGFPRYRGGPMFLAAHSGGRADGVPETAAQN